MIASDFELLMEDAMTGTVSEVPDDLYGTKERPLYIERDYNFQKDRAMAEIAISPCSSEDEFNDKIQMSLDHLNWYSGIYQYTLKQTAIIEKLSAKAMILGCEPSISAWTQGVIKPTLINTKPNLMTAGGHIHIDSKLDPFQVGRACDMFLGAYQTLHELPNERMSLYGKPGDIRIKPYGVEYRTLSNFWVFEEYHRRNIYKLSVIASEYNQEVPKEVFKMIRNKDKVLAQQILKGVL